MSLTEVVSELCSWQSEKSNSRSSELSINYVDNLFLNSF
jgi:hypothetical protein